MRSRFEPEARGAVLQAVRAGLTLEEAARSADLPAKTVRNWLSRGRSETGTEHARFAAAVDAAREAAEAARMEDGEFHACLARAVRGGSVTAMKLWWSIRREAAEEREVDPFSELDALDGLVERRDVRRASFIDELSDRKRRNGLDRLDANYEGADDVA